MTDVGLTGCRDNGEQTKTHSRERRVLQKARDTDVGHVTYVSHAQSHAVIHTLCRQCRALASRCLAAGFCEFPLRKLDLGHPCLTCSCPSESAFPACLRHFSLERPEAEPGDPAGIQFTLGYPSWWPQIFHQSTQIFKLS